MKAGKGAADAKAALEAKAAAEARAAAAEATAIQREAEVRAVQAEAGGGQAAAQAATKELRRQLDEATQAAAQQTKVIEVLSRERQARPHYLESNSSPPPSAPA